MLPVNQITLVFSVSHFTPLPIAFSSYVQP